MGAAPAAGEPAPAVGAPRAVARRGAIICRLSAGTVRAARSGPRAPRSQWHGGGSGSGFRSSFRVIAAWARFEAIAVWARFEAIAVWARVWMIAVRARFEAIAVRARVQVIAGRGSSGSRSRSRSRPLSDRPRGPTCLLRLAGFTDRELDPPTPATIRRCALVALVLASRGCGGAFSLSRCQRGERIRGSRPPTSEVVPAVFLLAMVLLPRGEQPAARATEDVPLGRDLGRFFL